MSVSIAVSRRTGSIVLVAIAVVAFAAFGLRGSAARAAVAQVTTGGSPIYGACTGQRSGVIKGDVTAAGHVGQWTISSIGDGLTLPRDAATGLPSGQVQHNPVKITMPAGPQTVKLIQSLVTNENLTTCNFYFYRPSPTGAQTNYLRIQLSNAGLGGYSLGGTSQGSTNTTFTLTYQKITWTWVQGGITASDSWSAPA